MAMSALTAISSLPGALRNGPNVYSTLYHQYHRQSSDGRDFPCGMTNRRCVSTVNSEQGEEMARSGKTPQEFIQASFSPIIAALCSPKVETAVAKNNLSFVQLLQPFTSLESEGQFREPNGTLCILKNWKLVVRDVNWKPLQPTEARRQLNNAVLHNHNERTTSLEIDGKKYILPLTTPWFDAWRETYLQVQFPSDHEFTKHFLSCMLVATTLEDNVIETFNVLNQQFAHLQNVSPPKLPKWFNNDVLKSYVLVHDVSSVSQDKADAMFETMKHNFEASNCFMLVINSRSTTDQLLTTDLWAPYIGTYCDSNNDTLSPLTHQPSSPLEPQTVIRAPIPPGDEDDENFPPPTQLETPHPLTNIENDIYDDANSLQTHSFSGSAESVSTAGRPLDPSTEVHGAALNTKDIEGIKKFIQDYATRSLLPYIEKQITTLSEVVKNRKGVSRSLLSATKRWFGTGKAGTNTVNNTVIYSSDCPELQLRRLGDLWFMCGQWARAFDTYHTAKREFYADGAWLCYAGALEMAALSAFMAGDANRKTHSYMEESIVTYLNTCRMVQYAVRATLLSAVCLSSSNLHGEAAKQLIRMTSEDSDLRSAMLLEQASLCFLSGPGSRAMRRKYAFHMVLAGHRFSKAGQKKHAYRCYKQAYQVYEESGWRLSTDHVQFALGRLAGALKQAREAASWLALPLSPRSPQPPQQHRAALRDYMLAHQQWRESCEGAHRELPALPLPRLDREHTAVLCAGPAPLSSPGRVPASSVTLADAHAHDPLDHKYWTRMEQMLVQTARGSLPMIFKPTVSLYTVRTESSPSVPQGEPIQISIKLSNPLKVALTLKELELLWKFQPHAEGSENQGESLNNEASVASGIVMENNVIYGQKIKSLVLEGECTEVLTFSLTPLQVGHLVVHGMAYKLVSGGEENRDPGSVITISGKLNLEEVEGARMSDSVQGSYKCLRITVVPCAPCLQMTFSETSPDAVSGEMRTVDVEFRNVGPCGMRRLYLCVSHPDCVQLVTRDPHHPAPPPDDHFDMLYEDKFKEPLTHIEERTAPELSWRAACGRHVRACGGAGGARGTLLLRPRASHRALYLLAYYEPEDGGSYRLLRHVFRFNVTEAVEVSALPRRSIATVNGSAAEKMNLAVEVKNVSTEKQGDLTVQVLEASLLGRQWKFTDYVSATKGKNDTLSSREKTHLVLEASRIRHEIQEDKIEWSSLKLAKGIPDSEPNINVQPYSKFVLEYKNSFVEDKDYFLRDSKPSSDGLIKSMLVVRWKVHNRTSGKSVVGQHCLWLECFTKVLSNERERTGLDMSSIEDSDTKMDIFDKSKNKKDNIVLFNLEHSPHINHNFKQSKLCLVPITINIVNCYGVPVEAFIDMSKNSGAWGALGWAGALHHGGGGGGGGGGAGGADTLEQGVSVSLAGLETRRVMVRALCAAPGTYLVGAAFTLTSRRVDSREPVSHLCNNSSLLVVRQATS